jgi:hypothetical protein
MWIVETLVVLDVLAEFEGDLIRTRTGEGRVDKACGVKMGRKSKMTPHQMKEALRGRRIRGVMGDIPGTFNFRHGTISRLAI